MPNKIAGFTLNSAEKNHLSSEIFVAQPDSLKEKLAGKLFALFEIEGKRSEALKLSSFIVDSLNENYYQDEKILLREKLENLKIENIFEAVLSRVNQEVQEFTEQEKLRLDPKKINITVGVAFNNEVYFSHAGYNHCFVIYKKDTKYEALPVAQEKSEENSTNFEKLFTSVISGDIPPGAFFVLSNAALSEYITSETIKEIITVLPPISATEQIKNRLKQINTYIPFSGIIIKNTFGQTEAENTVDSRGSIVNLRHTEEKTAKILSPAGIINSRKIKNLLNNIVNKIKPKKRDAAVVMAKKEDSKPIMISPPVDNKATDKKQLLGLKEKIFFKKKQGLVSWLKRLPIITYLLNPKHWKHWGKKLQPIAPFKLSGRNRTIFVVFILLIVIFLGNLTITNYRHKQTAKQQVYNENLNNIEQKQNQIDSYLLYGNEEAAKKLLQQTKDMISALPQDKDYQIENYNKYLEKTNSQSEAVEHVIKNDLQMISALPENSSAHNIYLLDNTLYLADANNKKIYTLDTKSESPSAETVDLNLDVKELSSPTVDKNNNLYYLNGNSLIELSLPEKEISQLDFNLPTEHGNIMAVAGYGNNFYILDQDKSQIYKYPKNNDGLSNSSNWINNNDNLEQPVNLAIDGNIYILQSNGQILKFYTGNKIDFNIGSVEPSINSAKKMILTDDSIYIIENNGQRLIRFDLNSDDTTADFKAQYQINNTIQDLTIDQTNNQAYILADNTVYNLDLNTIQ